MEAKFSVGEVVQLTLDVKKYFAVNAPKYVVEKIYDDRTLEFPEMEFRYDVCLQEYPSQKTFKVKEKHLCHNRWCY